MPEDMPLYVQRGPLLAALERFLDDPVNLFAVRQVLNDPTVDLTTVVDLSGVPGTQPADVHLRNDWFEIDATHRPPDGRPFSGSSNTETGFWVHYHGKVHEIVRQALQTAVDASLERPELPLGAVDDPLPSDPAHRPIQFLWDCTGPWFGAYVSWTTNQVTCVFHTPAPKGAKILDHYPDDTPDTTADNGHVVVTHESATAILAWYPEATPFGDWPIPGFGYRGDGKVTRKHYDGVEGGADPTPSGGDISLNLAPGGN